MCLLVGSARYGAPVLASIDRGQSDDRPEIAGPALLLQGVLNAQGRISAAVLASGTLHLLFTALCSYAELHAWQRPKARKIARPVEVRAAIDFELELAPSGGQVGPEVRTTEVRGKVVAKSVARSESGASSLARGELAARAVPAPTPSSDPASVARVEPAAVEAEQSAARAPASSQGGTSRALDLSPGAAARTLTASRAATWSIPEAAAASDDDRDVDRAAEARLAAAVPSLSRSGHDKLDHGAEALTWLAARPWEFILQPLRGARYNFLGIGFDAIIRADGSVQYRDKSGLHVAFSQATTQDNNAPGPGGKPVSTLGVGFHDAPASKLFGYDAHESERRRFLERTRALRELLHERALRVALARAAQHLTKSLAHIALKLEAGDERAAHAQLFALWDECAEDEVGFIARKRIEAFTREHCTEATSWAFAAAELLAFNQKRVSRQRFDPYATSPDAGVLTDAGSADTQRSPSDAL